MSLYKKVVLELTNNDYTKELYRFQGASSFEHFDFRTSRFTDNSKDAYVYFSASLEHHKYFTNKRIRQLLNKIVLKDTPYLISSHDIKYNDDNYKQIKRLIINTDKLKDMYSIKLISNRNAYDLISSNCIIQSHKSKEKVIERVDRRVLGGGYGLPGEWKELLIYLTYFSAYQKIDRKDILVLIDNIRENGKVNDKNNINFIMDNNDNYKVELTKSIESDFTKYKIIECLETIIDDGLYLEDSELGKSPSKKIKEVVVDYEKGKSKILSLLNKHSK